MNILEAAVRFAAAAVDIEAAKPAAIVRAQWGEVFARYLTAEDVDAVVADLVGHVKAKRDRLERLGTGRA